MASETITYPVLTISTWWKLRKKFNSSIPKEVTASYLATALEMSENSAKTNVLPKLKLLGFIDDDNKPTDLSIRWRDDNEYLKVCKELLTKLYPSELQDAIDDPLSNRDKVVKWFQGKARVGESAAQMMAAFYLLLVDANVSKQVSNSSAKPEKAKAKLKAQRVDETSRRNPVQNPNNQEEPQKPQFKPTVHLDIQIHISPESSAEQIDRIFESMAKHLGGFKM